MSIAWKWRTFDFFELWPRCISKVSWVQWFDSLHCGNFLSRRISIRFVVSLFLWLPILNKIVDRMFAYLTHFQVSAFFFCIFVVVVLLLCSFVRYFDVDDVFSISMELNFAFRFVIWTTRNNRHNAFYHTVFLLTFPLVSLKSVIFFVFWIFA